jgi:hypothetical protein
MGFAHISGTHSPAAAIEQPPPDPLLKLADLMIKELWAFHENRISSNST